MKGEEGEKLCSERGTASFASARRKGATKTLLFFHLGYEGATNPKPPIGTRKPPLAEC